MFSDSLFFKQASCPFLLKKKTNILPQMYIDCEKTFVGISFPLNLCSPGKHDYKKLIDKGPLNDKGSSSPLAIALCDPYSSGSL